MPKILIVANNALSKDDSNGRTLMNFLGMFTPDNIAQFHIHGQVDENCCKHHYQLSDQDILFAVKHFGKNRNASLNNKITLNQNIKTNSAALTSKVIKRSCRNLVLRDTVWCTYMWWDKNFDAFISNFAPDVVLLQAGDCPFMFHIALRIAKKYKVPLVMYNSEGYVLKKVLYSGSSKKDIWHNILQKRLKHAYQKMMNHVKYCFYITEYLERCYQEKYPHPNKSRAIYTSSEMEKLEDKSGSPFKLAYCGNLGVGRIQPLCEIAEVLQTVDSKATLNIYGSFNSDADEKRLCKYSNVRYWGRVPYETIPDIMSNANLVVHCENPNRLTNLIHAFSTKIADCLACGRPFLVYADERYPFVQYLKENNAAHIATDKEVLRKLLIQCIEDKAFLESHIQNALDLANRNHSISNNSKEFYSIVKQVIENYKAKVRA